MIDKASKDFPNQNWKLLDAEKDEITGKYDIVFSNATIQWIPNHVNLLKKFKNLLTENGVLAIQVPLFFDMPIGQTIKKISKEGEWSKETENVNNLFTIHNFSNYYDILSGLFGSLEIWESNYIHIMNSHLPILEMIRSTGLKPYLESIKNETEKCEFEENVLKGIKADYSLQKNGKVLFPFKRLFFIAKN